MFQFCFWENQWKSVGKQQRFYRILLIFVSLQGTDFSKGIFLFFILWKSHFFDAPIKQKKSFPQNNIFLFQKHTPLGIKTFCISLS